MSGSMPPWNPMWGPQPGPPMHVPPPPGQPPPPPQTAAPIPTMPNGMMPNAYPPNAWNSGQQTSAYATGNGWTQPPNYQNYQQWTGYGYPPQGWTQGYSYGKYLTEPIDLPLCYLLSSSKRLRGVRRGINYLIILIVVQSNQLVEYCPNILRHLPFYRSHIQQRLPLWPSYRTGGSEHSSGTSGTDSDGVQRGSQYWNIGRHVSTRSWWCTTCSAQCWFFRSSSSG